MNRFDNMSKDAMARVEEIMNSTKLNEFLHRKEEEEKKGWLKNFWDFFVTRPSSVIETGRMMIAINVISGEMLNIIINTPIMVAVAVMMVVMLWFKPCPSVSTSLVIRESTSP